MASIYFPFTTPAQSTIHIVFQMSVGFSGDIIRQVNTTTNFEQKLSYSGTTLTYYNGSNTSTFTYDNSIATGSPYIYLHLVILPTTAILYGMKNDAYKTISQLAIFTPNNATASTYDRLYIYGDCKFSYIWSVNKVQSNSEITSTLSYSYKPTSDINTVMLALFNNNLKAGVAQNISSPIVNWNIYKQSQNNPDNIFVGKVPASQKNLIDYLVENNNQTYIYSVVPLTETLFGAPMYSNPVTLNSWDWTLIDTVTKEKYFLGLDIESADFTTQSDRYIYNNFTELPKISVGKRNYVESSLSCTFGYVDSTGIYTGNSPEDYNKFRSFILNGNNKILKDRAGQLLICNTTNPKRKYDDKTIEQVLHVSFDFTEVSKKDNCQVFNHYPVWDNSLIWDNKMIWHNIL